MSLEVNFSIEKTKLLVGESPICLVQLKNTGSDSFEILQPLGGGGMPAFRVVNILTGAERVFYGNFEASGIPTTQMLSPDEVVPIHIPLLHNIDLLTAGEYLISAVYEFNNGKNKAESKPVKVIVHSQAVRNLFLDSVQGSSVYGVAVNQAADPPDIMLSRFDMMAEGGVGLVKAVGKGGLQTKPYISVTQNNEVSAGNWIGWLENNSLKFTHFDENMGVSSVGQFALPATNAEIVPPLYIKPNAEWGVRATGDVLLWNGDDGLRQSSLQVIHLVHTTGKDVVAKAGMTINFSAGRPIWAMHHARSDGARLVTFIEANKGRLTLSAVSVPVQEGAPVECTEMRSLQGDFVAAGATMGLDDVIRGAVLVWTGPEDKQKLELIGWSLDTGGALTEHYRTILPWSSTVPVGSAKVRVRENGDPAVLLSPLEVAWFVYDGYGKLVPVPAPYKETKLAIDIAFFRGSEVVLICLEEIGGFTVKRLDGSDLPSAPI